MKEMEYSFDHWIKILYSYLEAGTIIMKWWIVVTRFISTNTLVPKQNMNQRRSGHGLSKMVQKIFSFEGYNG